MSVYRHGKDIIPLPENVLLPVSRMIVDVQNTHLSVPAKEMSRNSCIIEIAESPEDLLFGMMTGRAHKRIG